MKVIDKQGATWEVDEGLRTRARQLQQDERYEDMISHVDLDQVIFLRVSNKKGDWLGKCIYFGKPPITLISKYVVNYMARKGLINLDAVQNFDEDIFDLRYFIALNEDNLNMVRENPDQVEELTLVHELMHIDPSGEKIVKHDCEDFSILVSRFGPLWGLGVIDESRNPFKGSSSSEEMSFEESK